MSCPGIDSLAIELTRHRSPRGCGRDDDWRGDHGRPVGARSDLAASRRLPVVDRR